VYGTYEPAFFIDTKLTVTPLSWMDIMTPLKTMELSLSVDNILNKKYYEYYLPMGRTFFAECTLRY
jgi:iron complex outermembrane receptor protein